MPEYTEFNHTIAGVPGIMRQLPRDNNTFAVQTWVSESRDAGKGYGMAARIRVNIRFDDSCGNGHNSFAITADIARAGFSFDSDAGFIAGGCLHDEIAEVFPELAHLIIWHLASTNGPMHYPGNALYHAGDRDYNGLRKGESRQIVNGRTGLPSWELVAVDQNGNKLGPGELPNYQDGETAPDSQYRLEWRPWCQIGEGKARDFDAARSCACWPDATDEQLSLPRDELRALLDARLPGLLDAMQSDIRAAGFAWSARELTAEA